MRNEMSVSEYSIQRDQENEIRRCDCCQYPGPISLFTNILTKRGPWDIWLCEICSNTRLSTAVEWPEQCNDPDLHKAVGWIGNYLAQLIREGKP